MLGNNGAIPEHLQTKKFAQRVLPSVWGSEGPTITATSLPDDYVHFLQPRTLTVREWARLQGFPDTFVIPVADASAYKQFGNSVAVPAIQATANKILELIGITNDNR